MPSSESSPLPSLGHDSPEATFASLDTTLQHEHEERFSNLVDGYGNTFEIPDFTINDVRKAIPKHCFQRSAVRGLSYIVRDVSLLVTTWYLFTTYTTATYIPSQFLRAVSWQIYGFLNGLFATGLWVLAHECGHGAFSDSPLVNDTVGFIFHSCLLVPYFSWKISHGKHHKHTGHMTKDMVHVPRTRELYSRRWSIPSEDLYEVVQDAPLYSALTIVVRSVFGWPGYLFTNVTGHNNHETQPEGRGRGKRNGLGGGVNHFDPKSPIFSSKDAPLIALSDVGCIIALACICWVGSSYGWAKLFRWYFLPYLWVNNWLVLITFLQHTDPSLAHYTGESWNFVRGAGSTIDRDLGFIGRHLFHGIIETHVLHHFVSTIPFYNADAATEAIKPILGSHYRSNTAGGSVGFVKSLWTVARMCRWVEPAAEATGISAEVLFYRNRNGLGPRPKDIRGDKTAQSPEDGKK